MSIFQRSVTCSFFFLRNCTHILARTQEEKFEDMFLVKIASKRTSLKKKGKEKDLQIVNRKENMMGTWEVAPFYQKIIALVGVQDIGTFEVAIVSCYNNMTSLFS